jgi:hypothetical protein
MKFLKQILFMTVLVIGLSVTGFGQKNDQKKPPPKDPDRPVVTPKDKPPKNPPSRPKGKPKKPEMGAVLLVGRLGEDAG